MKNFGAFLKYIRKQRGLTQEQVAEKLKIATPVLSKWENDKAIPSLDMVCGLCNILNVSIEECIAAEVYDGKRVLPPETYDGVKLGVVLKDLRIRNCLSQAEVGKKLFVTSQTVSKWEGGGVSSLEVLCALSDLFGVTPTELLNGLDCGQPAPIKKVKAKQQKKLALKITACIVSIIIILGAVAGLIAGLVFKSKNDGEKADLPAVIKPDDTEPKPDETNLKPDDTDPATKPQPDDTTPVTKPEPKPEITFVCPMKSFYEAKESHYNPVLDKADLALLLFEAMEGEEIYASADGVVTYCKAYSIIIASGEFTICYDNVEVQGVTVGSEVKAGQIIAKFTGNYLVFSLKLNGKPVAPLDYIKNLPEPVPRPQPPAHVHAWAWSNNVYNHRQNCECGESQIYGEHTFENNKCTICGYEKPVASADIDKTAYCLPVQAEIFRGHLEIFDNGGGDEEHFGVDFSAKTGDKVYAVADGVIEKIFKFRNSDCCSVTINHGNGLVSLYMGVSLADGVVEGSQIKKGDIIGCIANGPLPIEEADGVHLHFGMNYNGVSVNPLDYIPYEKGKT